MKHICLMTTRSEKHTHMDGCEPEKTTIQTAHSLHLLNLSDPPLPGEDYPSINLKVHRVPMTSTLYVVVCRELQFYPLKWL